MMTADTILASRYQPTELLSKKAGRETVLAVDLHTQVPVILKMLRFGEDFEWDDLKLFEREAATLKNLDHPNIPKYLNYFDINEPEDPSFALVQSYIEAPSLETLVRQGRNFSEAEVIELADRLLKLLTYLHQQCPPVIHRDIKPSNILLKNRSGNSIGDVYLIDFGSVQTVAKKEQGTITIVGSYGYMPLEQFGGETTTVSDLYSLGMTLIYLLTGIHPAELPQVDGQVQLNVPISKKLERWLDKMTHPSLEKRFDSAKTARLALKDKDGCYGDFNHLKPRGTPIRLYRDRNRLQITYPGGSKSIKNESLQSLVWISFCLSLIICFFNPITGVLLLIICFYTFILSRKNINITNSLTIDEHSFYKQRMFTSKDHSITEYTYPRSQIGVLVYSPGYQFNKCLNQQNRSIPGKTITIPPKLYLRLGTIEYYFPPYFSKLELWWLGNEISDFLEQKLQIINSNEIIP